jgi:hypothetical protein
LIACQKTNSSPPQVLFRIIATILALAVSLWIKMKTMKHLFLLFISGLFISVSARSQAYESSIQYNKKKQQAIAIDYSYTTEAVQNAIILKMEKLGYKYKEEKGLFNKDKGFLIFKNAYITDISSDRMDFYIKVERKGKKANEESTLYMVMNKNGENAMLTMTADDVNKAKSFLNKMLPEVEAADLEIRITDQQESVAKAEKKLKNLKDDQVNLEKKLSDNKADQEATQKDIEAQKQALGVLLGKRKTN